MVGGGKEDGRRRAVENRERRQVQSRAPWECAIVRAVFLLAFDTYTRPALARFVRSSKRAMNHRETMRLETLVEDTGTRLRKAQADG